MRATGEVLISPVATFRRFRDRRPLLGPWVSLSLAMLMVTLGTVSITQRAATHLLQETATPEMVDRVEASLHQMKVFSVAMAPLSLAVRWAGIALLMWALGVLVSPGTSFRTLLSVVALSAAPDVLGRTTDLAVTWHLGPEFRPDLTPSISPATSLAALFPASFGGPWVTALLDQLTPFSIWTGALWILGLREWEDMGGVRAAQIVLPPWIAVRLTGAALEVVRGSLASLGGFPPG
jgi:hypothetical protein